MDRDEILARNRMDNRHLDERDHKLADEASAWGGDSLNGYCCRDLSHPIAHKGRRTIRPARHPVRVPLRWGRVQMDQNKVALGVLDICSIHGPRHDLAMCLRAVGLMPL